MVIAADGRRKQMKRRIKVQARQIHPSVVTDAICLGEESEGCDDGLIKIEVHVVITDFQSSLCHMLPGVASKSQQFHVARDLWTVSCLVKFQEQGQVPSKYLP